VLDALDAVLVARGPESVYPLHRSRISDVQARPVVFRLTEGFYNPRAIIRRWAW